MLHTQPSHMVCPQNGLTSYAPLTWMTMNYSSLLKQWYVQNFFPLSQELTHQMNWCVPSLCPQALLYDLVAWYSLHAHARNEASQVRSAICSAKKWEMICQPAIFVKGFPDARASSSVILVYGVTIRWLHFAHAQSNCTRPLDQKEVWPGDKANACLASSAV